MDYRKYRFPIYLLLILIIFFSVRLNNIRKDEVFDIQQFSDYYSSSEVENGGDEILLDSFYTFERKYNFKISSEKREEQLMSVKKRYPSKNTYTVIQGDTLTGISQKFNIDIDIIRLNNEGINNNLKVNQKIWIPSENGIFYKVKKGDNINKISLNHKVSVEKIVEYNNINVEKLVAGEEIFIRLEERKQIVALLKSESPISKPISKPKPKTTITKRDSTKTVPDQVVQKTGKNSFLMPVSYKGVSSPYGNRFHPVLKRYSFHTGVDLIAKYVPLYASEDGVVSFVGTINGYGKIIKINHSGNYETRYAHLSKMSVAVGDKVSRGDLIGKTGNTGRTTGPHLHFEIRHNGKTTDPMHHLVRN